MAHYAETTEVPSDRSHAEIERTLERYGATAFMYGWDMQRAVISFDVAGRRYRIALPLPEKDDPTFTHSPTGRQRVRQTAPPPPMNRPNANVGAHWHCGSKPSLKRPPPASSPSRMPCCPSPSCQTDRPPASGSPHRSRLPI